MPTAEQVKQFLSIVVIPPLAGALSTWIFTSLHFLSIFHITADQTAKVITEVAVFGVSAGLAWLASHNILKGIYSPGAKASVATRPLKPAAIFSEGAVPKGTLATREGR